MMTNDILKIEIRLLIAKYGYRRVIEALASKESKSVDDIEFALRRIEEKRLVKTEKKSRKKSVAEIVETLVKEYPEKETQLKELGRQFQNKTFLPQLRDVKRFLGKFDANPKVTKSRQDAAVLLFRTLAQLELSDIEDLLQDEQSRGQSTFSLLAEEIIGDRGAGKR